jgi:hypothetical protein
MDPRILGSVIFDRQHPAILAEMERLKDTFDPERRWVQSDGYRLSDRVWMAGQETRRNIDSILKHAMSTGEDALVTAKKLEVYLLPQLQPIRDAQGRLVRDTAANRKRFPELAATQQRSVLTFAPGRGGRGSYPARRLSRTEISRAHAEATEQAAILNPWVRGVRWSLSGRHPRTDPCDQNARRDSGLGPGVYDPRHTPMMPNHPMCLCHWQYVTVEDPNAVVDALKLRYGLVGEDEPVVLTPERIGALRLVERAINVALRLIGLREAA